MVTGGKKVDTFIASSGFREPRRKVGSINQYFQSEEILVVATVAPHTSLSNVSVIKVIEDEDMNYISAKRLCIKVCAEERLNNECLIHIQFKFELHLSLQAEIRNQL